MVQGAIWSLNRLLTGLLLLLLAACAVNRNMPLRPVGGVPAGDAVLGTSAEQLLDNADRVLKMGRPKTAGLYLEQAIRMVPNSSWLYRQMAKVRLADSQPHSAEGFVRHAIRNAPKGNRRYRAGLYELLNTCLQQQGKKQAANNARQKAEALRNL